ncbi:hypothetical protein [Luteolibacter soli]|uniref:Uncharacterized protein n=1 Tax=Luteolibacter soli TaxID=3135280 RepID=A0ABU9B0X3_9BACT
MIYPAPPVILPRLAWKMAFESGGGGEKFPGFILGANEENFGRLETHLKSTP